MGPARTRPDATAAGPVSLSSAPDPHRGIPEFGAVDRAFFDEYVHPNLGADRRDVAVAPRHGVDFGAITVGGKAVAVATGPVFIAPSLGFERAAWFAFHALASKVAVSGLPPTHLSVDFNLPPKITDEQFETVWETFDAEARDLGVSVVTGHTGRYAGCVYLTVDGATSLTVGDPADLVYPDGAQAGDRIIVTKGPAVGATGLLSVRYEPLLSEEVDPGTVEAETSRLYDMIVVRDALTAAAAGPVTAMHGATEGGVRGGLVEMARASGVRFEVSTDPIPVLPGVVEAYDFFGIDPWTAVGEGALRLTVDPSGVEDVLAALDAEGVPAADAGEVVEGSGLEVNGEDTDRPGVDPFWAALEEYEGRQRESG